MGTPALIGLGSNLGDRKAHLDAAAAALADTPGVTLRAVSSYRETAPVGGPGGQGAFLNAAAAVETSLDPHALLRALQAIEARQGRTRLVRWGERTLDLDILLFGDRVLDAPDLTIPHPRMAFRRFVLAPMAEILPGAVDPLTGRTVAGLLANVDRRPSYLALAGDRSLSRALFPRLLAELPAAGLSGTWEREFRADRHDEPASTILGETGLAALGRMAHALRAERWAAELRDERWLITDFWFDLGDRPAAWPRAGEEAGLDHPYRRALRELREQVLRPTLVALVGDAGRVLREELRAQALHDPILRATPIFPLRPLGPDALADEVLAACAATRTG